MMKEDISSGVSSTEGAAWWVGGGTVTVARNASKSKFKSKSGMTTGWGSSVVGVLFNSRPNSSSKIK